ncbi:MAG: PhnD/SsuA/transferrin family substrate-binding protein [Ilumatobacteraceae bacterium]
MHLIGAFSHDLPHAEPPAHYRSVLLSPHDRPLADLVGSHAVSADSLSGWHSLRAATVGPGREWPGTVTFTSAHIDSLRALAKGEADLACIDSWSLAFIEAEEPDLVRDLFRVDSGPRIPTPAITARKSLGDDLVDDLRTAFADALADPATVSVRSTSPVSSNSSWTTTWPRSPSARIRPESGVQPGRSTRRGSPWSIASLVAILSE